MRYICRNNCLWICKLIYSEKTTENDVIKLQTNQVNILLLFIQHLYLTFITFLSHLLVGSILCFIFIFISTAGMFWLFYKKYAIYCFCNMSLIPEYIFVIILCNLFVKASNFLLFRESCVIACDRIFSFLNVQFFFLFLTKSTLEEGVNILIYMLLIVLLPENLYYFIFYLSHFNI